MNFYTYIYLDPRTEGNFSYGDYSFASKPFYVGRGSGNRMYDCVKRKRHNLSVWELTESIRNSGKEVTVIKVHSELSASDSILMEKHLISSIGFSDHGPLLNKTQGGEGQIHSDITKLKISETLTGYKHSEEFKSNARTRMIGNTHSKGNWEGEKNPMFGIKKLGTENTNAKHKYLITSPDGFGYYINTGCINIFCKAFGLGVWSIRESAKTYANMGVVIKTQKGWSAIKFFTSEDVTMGNQQPSLSSKLLGKVQRLSFGRSTPQWVEMGDILAIS